MPTESKRILTRSQQNRLAEYSRKAEQRAAKVKVAGYERKFAQPINDDHRRLSKWANVERKLLVLLGDISQKGSSKIDKENAERIRHLLEDQIADPS